MRSRFFLILLCFPVFFSLNAEADSQNALTTCLTEALDKDERRELAKWVFFSMAAHPELGTFATIAEKEREKNNRYVGKLFTQLFSNQCLVPLQEHTVNDPLALEKSFEFIGQLAMQELMTHPQTLSALDTYMDYTNEQKIYKGMKDK